MEQLLATKLFIPAIRSELVSRHRLIDQLNAGLQGRLTLVSAPAGFGKTTLVCEWVENLRNHRNQNYGIAWLSLDESDNTLTRFLTYIIAALNQSRIPGEAIGKTTLDMLQSPQPPQHESVLIALINELAATPDKIILILDDYHLIDAQPVHAALNYLVDNSPTQLHLVIATREDPFLPLSRLRVRGELNELRAADLRFTSSEAAEFLNRTMKLSLSQDDISALETRTEGWIAGLHLAAISMQKLEDVSPFVKSFTGSHRLVLDYLIEEVLSQQADEIQAFLLQTAVLNRLNGSLCDSLTGQVNSHLVLESLERANLFIIPLDNERHWYRYHHLFAELLKQRLSHTHPSLIPELHLKAATWYEGDGDLAEAIYHAFAGNSLTTAVRLIEKGALDALERSDFGFILDTVDRIPAGVQESSPWLFVYHCWALLLTGQIAMAIPKIESTDWLMESLPSDEAQIRRMRGYIAGLKCQLAAWQRDFEKTNAWADQAKAYLPEKHWIRAYCAMMVGVSFWDTGNLAAALESFKEAAAIGDVCRNRRVAVTSAIYHGHARELQGQLQQAARIYQDAFECAQQDGRELPVACYLNIDFARILYERNELGRAVQHFTQGIRQSQLLGDTRIEAIGNSLLTRAHLASNDYGNAAAAIRNAEKFIPSPDIVYDMRGGEFPHVRLWLKQRDLHKLESWLQNDNQHPSADFKTRLTYVMHARVMVALARDFPNGDSFLTQAHKLLATLLDLAESNGWGSKLIEILVLQSLAFDLAGDKKSAMTALERALRLAEPEGFIRTFVDEGPPMARLLYEILSSGNPSDYVQRLLAAFPDPAPEQAPVLQTDPPEVGLVEPLSERELEILQLVANGLTNQKIGAQLYLSLNTVKAHTRNIYGKLGVNSRTQAVARARILGILAAD